MKNKKAKYKLTNKLINKLYKDLRNEKSEKDVENAWREFFSAYYNSGSDHDLVVTSPYDTDGYLEVEGGLFFFLRILMEFKEGTDLNKLTDRVRIVIQCVHYLKKFEENGDELPNVIVGADEDQAFVLYAPNFYKYLKGDYPWDIAPSSAYKKDPKMYGDLLRDNNLAVWVYNLNNITPKERKDNLQSLFDEIHDLTDSKGQEYKVKVTEANVSGLFENFKDIGFTKNGDITPRQAVNIFMQTMVGNNDEYYLKPTSPNMLHTDQGYIPVNGAAIQAFYKHFDRNIKPAEQDKMFSMADRLIEDEARREKGDFWTPTVWANKADQMMQEVIGKDYKEDAVIWDCAAGTKNLTRDFYYNNLYSSTLFESELLLGKKYNPEATSFTYDFLNDDVENTPENTPNPKDWKMPESLLNELKTNDKPIVFYTNPPYGTSGKLQKDGTSKKNMSNNLVNKYMRKEQYGKASQQLYAQFYARILKLVNDFNLKNVYIAFFNNTRHFSGGDYWEKFNTKLFRNFELKLANMFNASEFSDTSDTWPITFSIYKLKKNPNCDIKKLTFDLDVEKSKYNPQEGTYKILDLQTKHTHPVYNDSALSEWMKKPLADKKYQPMDPQKYPKLSSAMSESKGKKPTGVLYEHSLGYIMNSANNVGEGTTNGGVWIGTSAAYHGHGINVMPENFERVIVNFAARRSITPTWINAQDNFMYPNTNNDIYKEYINDALVFSLFDTASNQAAYRNWKQFQNTNVANKWINEWFWLSKDFVLQKANELNQAAIYNDARADKDRFVYKQIQNRQFSSEAQQVLDLATQVWIEQLQFRDAAINELPELSLNAWDAGWAQMKAIDRNFPAETMPKLKEAIKVLKVKLENNTYKLHMLVK